MPFTIRIELHKDGVAKKAHEYVESFIGPKACCCALLAGIVSMYTTAHCGERP